MFAVPSLKKIVAGGHRVVAVISQPDREADKKGRLLPTLVKTAAIELNLPVYQFDSVSKEVDFIVSLKPDLMVTAAFGQMLSDAFLAVAPVFNVHASLLPLYRGSAPIQAAILNGDAYTGITIMRTVKEMDAGDIVLQDKIAIESGDTYGTLHDKLAQVGADLIAKAIGDFANAKTVFTPQEKHAATYVKKITKADRWID